MQVKKSSALLCTLLLVAAVATAQTPPAQQPAAPSADAPTTAPQQPATVPPPPTAQPDLTAAPAPGSDAPQTLRLTITDAIRMALDEGTQAALARTGEARARVAEREALSNLLPQADVSLMRYSQSVNLETFGFAQPGQPPVVGPFNVTDAQVNAAVQLFNLAALRRLEAMRVGVQASKHDVQRSENDLAAAVARLYILIQRADAQVASRTADEKLFTTLAKVADDEFRAGTGTRLDVAQANVQVARARQALLSARNDRESARLALLNAIGANQASSVILADSLTPPATQPALGDALTTARARRPELQQLTSAEKQAQLVVDAFRARRLPSVALDFQGDLSGNHNEDLHSSRRVAAVASMPLFRADVNAQIARAKLDLEDVRTRRSAAERDVEQQVRTSLMSLENANARVAVASENVTVAEQALTIARDRRSAGYGSPVEVDRAEDAYRQAHEDLIAARADATMAWFGLQHATGEIRSVFPESR